MRGVPRRTVAAVTDELAPGFDLRAASLAAVSAAFQHPAGAPLLDAAELLVRGIVRATELYPEWAKALRENANEEIDAIARVIAARDARGLGAR